VPLPSERTPERPERRQRSGTLPSTEELRPARITTPAEQEAADATAARARRGVAAVLCGEQGVDPDYEHALPDLAARHARAVADNPVGLRRAATQFGLLRDMLGLTGVTVPQKCLRRGCPNLAQEHRSSFGVERYDLHGYCSWACATRKVRR
jgi:hypothetical protein